MRFEPLALRFGFGRAPAGKGAPDRFGVPAGEDVAELRSRVSPVSSFLGALVTAGVASASASAFARWNAS